MRIVRASQARSVQSEELWETSPTVKEAIEVAMAAENMRLFRKRLFSRIACRP